MREQLIQYVQLLFAGVEDCDDIRQEILQNTLDRYDDLIAAGKTPEAAYRLAIMGIGDINEILGRAPGAAPLPAPAVKPEEPGVDDLLVMVLFPRATWDEVQRLAADLHVSHQEALGAALLLLRARTDEELGR